jgi:hypothetical protein
MSKAIVLFGEPGNPPQRHTEVVIEPPETLIGFSEEKPDVTQERNLFDHIIIISTVLLATMAFVNIIKS